MGSSIAYIFVEKRPVINTIYIYIIGYSIARFILEFLRGDESERGFLFFLSTSQIISIILIIVTLLYMKHNKTS
ncbi:MAG: hypothetical protein GX288_09760 [Clostridiales bacterium]|nr:hypothetical protein [Clostridiales bacterium]